MKPIELLKQYNIHFVAETCHLMIADAAGKVGRRRVHRRRAETDDHARELAGLHESPALRQKRGPRTTKRCSRYQTGIRRS